MVRDIARGRLDGGKGPVVERSWIVLLRVDTVVLDRALGSEEADVEDVGCVRVEHRGQLADGAIGEFERSNRHRVVLVVHVELWTRRKCGDLCDLAREVADRVGGMAAGCDKRTASERHRDRPRIAGILLLERMPVVGFRVDHVAEHAVGLELFDRHELGVPAKHERGHALHLGVRYRLVDPAYAGVVEGDRLLDDHVAT